MTLAFYQLSLRGYRRISPLMLHESINFYLTQTPKPLMISREIEVN